MRNPLLREITIMLLAALPMLWLIIACQTSHVGDSAGFVAEQLAALPAQGGAAPLLAPVATGDASAARARNSADPFFSGPLEAARPFHFAGNSADLANARDCLALAALAEAGPSDSGQRAVIQVVLNRVRHPAFPRTICGTVFAGAERATGCQFTFTCDGALTRRYGRQAWIDARFRAEQALQGFVFSPVGTATHYHTDWVYPAWSPQLLKIAQVDTHLFFRWPGYWGSRAAGRMTYRGGEPAFAVLAGWNGDAAGAPDPAAARAALPADTPKVASGTVMLRDPSGKANFLLLSAGASARAALDSARQLCNSVGTCRVYGWTDATRVPAALPLTREARAALEFSYARDPGGAEIVLYNCDTFPATAREACIPRAR